MAQTIIDMPINQPTGFPPVPGMSSSAPVVPFQSLPNASGIPVFTKRSVEKKVIQQSFPFPLPSLTPFPLPPLTPTPLFKPPSSFAFPNVVTLSDWCGVPQTSLIPTYTFGAPSTPARIIQPLPLPPNQSRSDDNKEDISQCEQITFSLPISPIQVQLRSHQIEHTQNIIKIFTSTNHDNTWAMDLSVMGAGKTHIASYLEQYFRWPYMIVICPVSVEGTWQKAQSMYGLPIVAIISYESLRGNAATSNLSHGLLTRDGNEDDGIPIFRPTPKLLQLVQSGTLFVFDEIQKAKNINAIHYAVKAIVQTSRGVIKGNVGATTNASRILIASGTPFDKEVQITNFLRMLGIIRHRNMFVNQNGFMDIDGYGAGELWNYCQAFSPEETSKAGSKIPLTKNNMQKFVYNMYIDVIQKYMTSSMPSPPIPVPIECLNGYYNLSKERAERLSAAINALRKATHFRDGEVDMDNANWGAITSSLRESEYSKVEIFVREAYNRLTEDPRCKVALFFNYKVSINAARALLALFNPIILEGGTPKKKRPELIAQFQQKNTRNRVIICNCTVGALGIDLDDTLGTMPRYAFVSPSYYAMTLHQITRRFYRTDTKSTPHIRFIFGKCGIEETSIINALARKMAVMKQTLVRQAEEGIRFPGEYDKYVQPDDEPMMKIEYYDEILDGDNGEEDVQIMNLGFEKLLM